MTFDLVKADGWTAETVAESADFEQMDINITQAFDLRENKTNLVKSVNTFSGTNTFNNTTTTQDLVTTSIEASTVQVSNTLDINCAVTIDHGMTFTAYPGLTGQNDIKSGYFPQDFNLIKCPSTVQSVEGILYTKTNEATIHPGHTYVTYSTSVPNYWHFGVNKSLLLRGQTLNYIYFYFQPEGTVSGITDTISVSLHKIEPVTATGTDKDAVSSTLIVDDVYYTTYSSWAGAIRSLILPVTSNNVIDNSNYQLRVKLGASVNSNQICLIGARFIYASVTSLGNF